MGFNSGFKGLNCNYSFWFYTRLSLPAAVMAQPWQRLATTNVCKTRSCNYSLEAPDDDIARNMLSSQGTME